ncbi:Major facilitator superfamily domain, general substrate transporter [Akanthomyces lecanii RCEF 1005]|uniref:Major facilitator superfamily domain, general substrate transporter n=1 Tax=Akanthomyces lecanii RCEF 1005 TaxID=1081108 RepID=A0A162KL90_CORDF|nr:Major facilitator superfamily domain, general substrate transporter [Akanthomyces lecanii RCEF 1005]
MAECKESAAIDGGVIEKTASTTIATTSTMLSPEEDKRLLRKIDLCLLPILAVSYMFQYLDKSALSLTAILGIREDLGVSGSAYSWANSVYYFGYLIASYPAAALMVRLPTGKTIAASILIWGCILIMTPLCFNSAGLLANRFFLGATEAAIAPGLGVLVSMWYKRSEQPLRHAAWFLGNTFAGMVGNLMGYGIGHIHTIASWKAVFAIFGAATVAWGIAMVMVLPDVPNKAFFLSKEDRERAILRVQENMTGIKNNNIKWPQVREALTDPKAWILVLIQLCSNIPNGGVASFGPIIIQGMGFSTFSTLLLNSLSYVFQAAFVLIATIGSTYLRNTRTLWIAWGFSMSLAGAIMVRVLDPSQRWSRFIGYSFLLGYVCSFPLNISMITSNTGGFTKKMTMNSMIFIAYCVGNIIGPQLFFARESPKYTSGFLAMLVCYAAGIVLCMLLRFYLVWENRRRDKAAGGAVQLVDTEAINQADLTDKEIAEFRYVY